MNELHLTKPETGENFQNYHTAVPDVFYMQRYGCGIAVSKRPW